MTRRKLKLQHVTSSTSDENSQAQAMFSSSQSCIPSSSSGNISQSTPSSSKSCTSEAEKECSLNEPSAHEIPALEQPSRPYQPCPSDLVQIPPKATKSQNVNFQYKWFKLWPWLHYSESLKGVLCFTCSSADQQGLLKLANKKEDAFISTGFNNWKKVSSLGRHKLGRFQEHEMSETHKFAAAQLKAQKQATVVAQVADPKCNQQDINRRMLVKVLTSVRYLARQGLPLRRHTNDEGNFCQLLHLREEDDPNLAIYTARATNYISPQAQNEMLKDFSHNVLRQIVKNVRNNGIFALMVDGTQDITGVEQESVCIRHVDEDLNIHEDFVGLYEVPSSSGETISVIILDVLTRLGLSINNLRAQTYDGASNMSGKYNGCQAKIKEQQPLAMFSHCSSHVSNLVMQHAVTTSPLVRDVLQWVQDLGVLYSRSGRYKAIFKGIAYQPHSGTSTASIRPLCPTCWLCRQSAIESVVNNYGAVLESLEEMSMSGTSDTATKANGLLDRFQEGEILLALNMVNKSLSLLETLNAGLQARTATISGMKTAVNTVMSELQALRTATVFETIFSDTSSLIVKHNLEPLRLPRLRKPPARLSGEGSAHRANTAEEHFRIAYYQHIDGILSNLSERFGQGSKADLGNYEKLEQIITKGMVDQEILHKYPELTTNLTAFKMQLDMFLHTTKATTPGSAVISYQNMSSDVRVLFPQVKSLLKLMLVCPVSSCECERSFSGLRRLKTWLRSTMTQTRLNSCAICNIHKSILDSIDVIQLAKQFVSRSETRKNMYGNFTEV